jgi:alkylation response protein AidB-like acyl-CoA dehydrogenase
MVATPVDEVLDRVERIADVIRDGADESEKLGHLAPAVVDALHEANLFRMLVPEDFGGIGLTIPDSIEVVVRVAELDASTGWNLAILGGGPVFARLLSPDAFATICRDPYGLAAGSLNPMTTRVEAVGGGFVFSGTATYLSGSQHAKYIMATGIVMENGAPRTTDGFIEIRAGVFPIERARCLDTWHVTGMRATGSSDYEFDGVEVDGGWTFEPFRARAHRDDVFSRLPLWSQLGSGLAACAVGAAHNMLDRFAEFAAGKVPIGVVPTPLAERAGAQAAFGEAFSMYQAAHAVLGESVREVWARGVAGEPFENEFLARQRLRLVAAVRLSAQAVDILHDVAGMTAITSDSVLDRCWRDVHTITQHLVLNPARFEIAGRVLLGLDAASPLI